MPMTVDDLIANRELTWVAQGTPVRDAVKLMVDRDYSQVPVIDSRGSVLGLFTERRLAQEANQGSITYVLDGPVEQFIERPPVVIGRTRSVYEVAALLSRVCGVVVAENHKAIGIITDYDIAAFLVQWSEGLALAEDIEKRLRGYIEHVFTTPHALNAALHAAFGHDRKDMSKPGKAYDELTLHDHGQFITSDDNWPRFEPYLQPKKLFTHYVELTRPIRNQIAHFRGTLTHEQLITLKNVPQWLERCPRVPTSAERVPAPVAAEAASES